MKKQGARIPGTSYEELEKIIMGYAQFEEPVSLDDLAKRIGKDRTVISPSNPFLIQVGLIQGGRDKKPTPLGNRLGRAIEHHQDEDVKACWREVVSSVEFLSGLVSTVRIKRGMTSDELAKHVLYAGNLSKNNRNTAGANSIVEILKKTGLLHQAQDSDKLVVDSVPPPAPSINELDKTPPAPPLPPPHVQQASEGAELPVLTQKHPTVTINIELSIPPTENPVVYENLFRALREHLLPAEKRADGK